MKTLVFLQSAPLIGPIGWLFGVVALAFIGLFIRLWLSAKNTERVAMERELKEGRKLLVELRSELLTLGQRNAELAKENIDLKAIIIEQNKAIKRADEAREFLEKSVHDQGLINGRLTDQLARMEKAIMKQAMEGGATVDEIMAILHGPKENKKDLPEAPGIGE